MKAKTNYLLKANIFTCEQVNPVYKSTPPYQSPKIRLSFCAIVEISIVVLLETIDLLLWMEFSMHMHHHD